MEQLGGLLSKSAIVKVIVLYTIGSIYLYGWMCMFEREGRERERERAKI